MQQTAPTFDGDQLIHFTLFPDPFARNMKPCEAAWSDLAARMLNPPERATKADCSLIKLATFGQQRTPHGSLRSNENLVEIHGIEGDYDAGRVPLESAAAMLRDTGVEAVICTTASHTAEAPRWRVFVPLSRAHAPAMRRHFVGVLNRLLGGVLARESFTDSQAFYWGRVSGKPFEARHVEGTPIDLLPSPPEPLEPSKAPLAQRVDPSMGGGDDMRAVDRQGALARADAATIESLRSALTAISADERDTWVRMGQALASLKSSDWEEAARELWVEWSANSPNHNPNIDPDQWKTFAGSRSDYRVVFAEATRRGWINPAGAKQREAPDASKSVASATSVASTLTTAPVTPLISNGGKRAIDIATVVAALRRPDICGKRIGWDSFHSAVMVAEVTDGDPQWRELTDVDNTRMREHLQRCHGFGNIAKETMRDTMEMVAHEHQFDSAQVWLQRLQWDGVARVDSFLVRYFGAEDTPYTRAVSMYIWTALAGRIMVPGIKADMVPVAVGKQGAGKSRSIAAMAPSPDLFGELGLDLRDDDTFRMLRGKVILELPELSGLGKRDTESLKKFLTSGADEWVAKYKEHRARHPRRMIFFGSSNRDDFLADDTGHRRWLPFMSGQCDPDGLARDCEQLWAEAFVMFQATGIEYAEAERLARAVHEDFSEIDEWVPVIAEWLERPVHGDPDVCSLVAETQGASGSFDAFDEPGKPRNVVTARQVVKGALNRLDTQITRGDEMRAARALKSIRWVAERRSVSGARARVFLRPAASAG